MARAGEPIFLIGSGRVWVDPDYDVTGIREVLLVEYGTEVREPESRVFTVRYD